MTKPGATLPAVDLIKAVASHLIVLHHLAFYGPMSDAVAVRAPWLIGWLAEHGRLAVAAFFAVGGFLCARSLIPAPNEVRAASAPRWLGSTLWRRYTRLALPLVAALLLAVVCAWIARAIAPHESTPAAPSLPQLLAHLVFAQDLLGVPALSAGLWYVAIDFQLFAVIATVCWASVAMFGSTRAAAVAASVALGAAMVASIVWFNRQPALDVWWIYFIGSYGLGMLAAWAGRANGGNRTAWIVVTVVLAATAWVVEPRARISVAAATAMLLVWAHAPTWARHPVIGRLSAWSYALFLVHYPVGLVINAVVHRFWPAEFVPNTLGMLAAWLASVPVAAALHRVAERPRMRT